MRECTQCPCCTGVGGYSGIFASTSVESNTVEAYDPVTNTWTTLAALPGGRGRLGVGVIEGILYAVGGSHVLPASDHFYLDSVEAFDPSANTWTTRKPMLTARDGLAVGVVNGILYAVGGYNNQYRYIPTVEAYDPSTNTWSTRAPLPTSRAELAAGVVNGPLYAVGGVWVSLPAVIFQQRVDAYTPRLPSAESVRHPYPYRTRGPWGKGLAKR